MQISLLRIDLQETNFLISLGVPIVLSFSNSQACTLKFLFVCTFTSGRMNHWLLKAVSEIFEGLEKEEWDEAWLVDRVESIGSFQFSMCFIKASRASAHAPQTKQGRRANWNVTQNIGKVSLVVFSGSGGEPHTRFKLTERAAKKAQQH